MDTERIKRRIRGLLNLAADDAATDGEITAAMNTAIQLMNKYQLEQADLEAAVPAATREQERFAAVDVPGQKRQCLTWEVALARACEHLLGSVGHYSDTSRRLKTGTFERPASCFVFYGPAEDAALASELFLEWATVIATMALGKYGGFCQGDGGRYAYGFACALEDQAQRAHQQRHEVVTESTRAIVPVGDGSLALALEKKVKTARLWLAREKGVHLRMTSRAGYRSGSYDAFAAGAADGSRADFSAKRKPKLTAGPGRLPQ